MRNKKGIGIFGLTADPFHNGHLQIISELAEKPYINRLDVCIVTGKQIGRAHV